MFWIYVGLGVSALLAAVAWGIRVVLWSFGQIAAAIEEVEETI